MLITAGDVLVFNGLLAQGIRPNTFGRLSLAIRVNGIGAEYATAELTPLGRHLLGLDRWGN